MYVCVHVSVNIPASVARNGSAHVYQCVKTPSSRCLVLIVCACAPLIMHVKIIHEDRYMQTDEVRGLVAYVLVNVKLHTNHVE